MKKRLIKRLKRYDDGSKTYDANTGIAYGTLPNVDVVGLFNWDKWNDDWQNYWGKQGAGYVSQAQEAAAPYVGAAIYGPMAAMAAPAVLSNIPWGGLRTLAGEAAAGELAATAWNQMYKTMSGKDWHTGVQDAIEGLTGYRMSDGAASMLNPGYFFGGAAKKGVELAVDGLKKLPGITDRALRILNSPITGEWVPIGGRLYRLSPNSLGASGVPLESRSAEEARLAAFARQYAENRQLAINTANRTATAVGEQPRTINPVVQEAPNSRVSAASNSTTGVPRTPVQNSSSRVIEPPTTAQPINNNILQDYTQLREAAEQGGDQFERLLDAISDESGLSREFLDTYADYMHHNMNSVYGRRDFLYDYGLRLNGANGSVTRSNPAPAFTRKSGEYKHALRTEDILGNHPEQIQNVRDLLSAISGIDARTLQDHLYGLEDRQIAGSLANDGWTALDVINNITDSFSNLRSLNNMGVNLLNVLSKEGLERFEKLGFSANDVVNLIKTKSRNKAIRNFTRLSDLIDSVEDSQAVYPLADIKKIFSGDFPKFETGSGLNFNQQEMELLFNELYHGNTIHPNFERGTPKSQVVQEIRSKFNEALLRPEFQTQELMGGDFSADSSPMIWSIAEKLSNARAAEGKFPGQILVNPGTQTGNGFANVNLARPGETPYINGGFELEGSTPTVEEIANFKNRKQAIDEINYKMALAYKAFMKNSKGLKNMPNYGLDEDMVNAVIKARGNIDAVPGAANATFGGEGLTPVWSAFPETERRPIYPNIRILFDKGKSIHIKPANKGKFKATMKRTGKSAEELSHSKNPKTRKRAIFALNARKWKH